MGLSTGGTSPVTSPEVQLNSFLFTASEENDAQENMCQKDSTAELGTEPRPSSPRTRHHSVTFPFICSRHKPAWTLFNRDNPIRGTTRQSTMCASPSLSLSFCSTQQSIGTLTEYLSDRENERKEKEKKSSLNSEFFNLLFLKAWILPGDLKTSFGQISKGLKTSVEWWPLSACFDKRCLWEKKIYTFLVPKGIIFIMSMWQVCKFQQ